MSATRMSFVMSMSARFPIIVIAGEFGTGIEGSLPRCSASLTSGRKGTRNAAGSPGWSASSRNWLPTTVTDGRETDPQPPPRQPRTPRGRDHDDELLGKRCIPLVRRGRPCLQVADDVPPGRGGVHYLAHRPQCCGYDVIAPVDLGRGQEPHAVRRTIRQSGRYRSRDRCPPPGPTRTSRPLEGQRYPRAARRR